MEMPAAKTTVTDDDMSENDDDELLLIHDESDGKNGTIMVLKPEQFCERQR